MKTTTTALILIMAATTATAIKPDKKWLDLVEQVESSGNSKAVGDSGRARGAFQFWKIAWDDVNNYRRDRGFKIFGYEYAWDPHVSRVYAENLADLQRIRMIRATGRDPDAGELYALYNLGFNGFKRRQFRLNDCPRVTRVKAAKIKKAWEAK
tara:strand:- start:312 stop:770 length:459 start_codon:yes stop_codon:yes gene_type:complete